MSVGEQQRVAFFELNQNYYINNELVTSFELLGFEFQDDDFVGIFDYANISTRSPIKRITSDDFSNHCDKIDECVENNYRITIKILLDFDLFSSIESCILRYVRKDNVLGESEPFFISSTTPDCVLTMKECSSSEADIILVDKESYKTSFEVRDDQCLSENYCLKTKVLLNEKSSQTTKKEINLTFTVESLARSLAKQMRFIDKQSKEIGELELQNNFFKETNKALKEDCEAYEELANELNDTKSQSETFKEEFLKLSNELINKEETLEEFQQRYIDDREQFLQEIIYLKKQRNSALEKIKFQRECLEEEKEKGKEALENLKLEIEVLKETEKLENENSINIEKMKVEWENEKNTLKTQIENRDHQLISLKEQIEELESRVCNESSNASRLENDIIIAENRVKEATDDIKYFRKKFLDAEQIIQQKQNVIAKLSEKINELKQSNSASATTEADFNSKEGLYAIGETLEKLLSEDEEMNETYPESDNKDEEGCETKSEFFCDSNNYSHPISVLSKSRRYGKPIDMNIVSTADTSPSTDFQSNTTASTKTTKDVSHVDRATLEKQYHFVRQHRNSLIRENNFLKNRVTALSQELIVMNANFQNSLTVLPNTCFCNASKADSPLSSPTTASLSPYAKEYNPSINTSQTTVFPPPPIFLPPPFIFPPAPAGFFEFMAAHAAESYFNVPLPTTSFPQTHVQNEQLIDISEQLSGMGINITKSI